MDTVTAHDETGTYTGTLTHLDPYDGWATIRIETAPPSKQMWIGETIEFPPSEIVGTVCS